MHLCVFLNIVDFFFPTRYSMVDFFPPVHSRYSMHLCVFLWGCWLLSNMVKDQKETHHFAWAV
jgi:hypothetical protein